MRARLGRSLALSVAITLSVALVLPPGFAFGGGTTGATDPVERAVAERVPVAAGAIRKRVSPVEPLAPAAKQSPARPVPDAGVSRASESTFVVDPLAPAVPGELVVVLDSSIAAASTESALEARGAKVECADDSSSLLVRTPLSVSAPLFTQLVADTPGVAWVQPNYIYQATFVPNDPGFPEQWALTAIEATAAWDVTRGTNNVVVAVVDSGVDYTHPDLIGRIDTANDHDFVNGDDDALDDNGHGTHVSGILSATMDNAIGVAGVAPGCRILPVKVLSAAGWGDSAGVAAGIEYAADNGAEIINLSLAGPADRAMSAAVAYARGKGCIVVAAAGNEGSAAGAGYPARYAGVLGVGAVDSRHARTSFSNYGTGVDVAAPGLAILSTLPGGRYEYMSGTSMASPFVAGVAALLLSSEPSLDATAVVGRILDTATDLAPSLLVGNLLNAAAALGPARPPAGADIPGLLLESSPVRGSLDSSSDPHRVYRVYLGAGQTVQASLAEGAGSSDLDLDLSLYGPGSESIATGARVAYSVGPDDPETISYTAAVSGWHCFDVWAVEGAGAYALTWSRSGASDDDIPGITLSASPLAGSVDRSTDPEDVHAVHLEKDDLLVVGLTGPTGGTDMDLYLYGPEATSIFTDVPLDGSNAPGTPNEWFRYRASKAGTYYVDVQAFSGSGAYVLTWQVIPGMPTDNIPGVESTSSPLSGAIGGPSNTDDVYRVYVQAGQTLDLTMAAPSNPVGERYPRLLLYSPIATDVEIDADAIVAGADSGTGDARISYTATVTGYHYIDVYSLDLGEPVAYEIEWSATRSPDDDIRGVLATPSPIRGALGSTTDTDDVFRIHANAGQWISASLTGSPTATTDFDLYVYSPGATDIRSAAPLTETQGGKYPKSVGVKAPVTGDYYLHAHAFAGEGPYTLAWSVRSFATVYRPVAPSGVTRGRHFTVYGYVSPRHTSSTYYLATLHFYLRGSSGQYVYHHSVKARRYSYSSTRSRYSARTSLPHKGKWRVRAVHTDTGMPGSYSAYDYITVR